MTKNLVITGLFLAPALLFNGCVSQYPDPRTRKVTQQREDFLIIQEDIRRMQGQIEGLGMETEALRRDADQARYSRDSASSQEAERMEGRISQLETRIAALETARARDRQEIIDTLTANMTKALAQSAPRNTPRATKPRPKSEYVLEHIVESGQTLSEIARAYGTSVQVIMSENDLTNPNQIRAGQVLYIPE